MMWRTYIPLSVRSVRFMAHINVGAVSVGVGSGGVVVDQEVVVFIVVGEYDDLSRSPHLLELNIGVPHDSRALLGLILRLPAFRRGSNEEAGLD